MDDSTSAQNGFTLIELLIVVLIIGILASIAIPVFNGQRAKAKDAKTKSALMNSVGAFKSVYLDKEGFTTTSVTTASDNEKGLNIVAASPAIYKKAEIDADLPDVRTLVAVQKSDSGRDFCVVSKEDGPNAGVYRSWEIADQAALTSLGCPSSSNMALGGGAVVLKAESPVATVSGGTTSGSTGSTGSTGGSTGGSGGGGSANTDYGDYYAVRNTLLPEAKCSFNDAGASYSNISCTGISGGQYKESGVSKDFVAQQEGAIQTFSGGAASNDGGNKSVKFNSTNHYTSLGSGVSIANSGSTNKDWSTEIWVKPNSTSGTQGILGDQSMFGLAVSSSGFQGGVRQTQNGYDFKTVTGNTPVTAGQWYHVVMTWSNGTLKLYVNGTLKGTSTGIGGLNTGNNNIQLGWSQGWQETRLNGWLDEFSFYNKTLSLAQVKSLYEAGSQTAAN